MYKVAKKGNGAVAGDGPSPADGELADRLRPWLARAEGLVGRRLDDALSHAQRGNHRTAVARLEELHEALYQHAQEARGAFYRQAFAMHDRAGLDPSVHQLGLAPDHGGDEVCRRARILGRSFPDDLRGLIRAAAKNVLPVGDDESTPSPPYAAMWRLIHGKRINDLVKRELSDSQMAIFHAIGQVLIKPELR